MTVTISAADVVETDLAQVCQVVDKLPPESVLRFALQSMMKTVRDGGDILMYGGSPNLSPEQASQVLGVSRPHVYKLLDSGALPHHRVGTHRRLAVKDLADFIEARDAARQQMAHNFAHVDGTRSRVTARLAGVDEDTAARLGF